MVASSSGCSCHGFRVACGSLKGGWNFWNVVKTVWNGHCACSPTGGNRSPNGMCGSLRIEAKEHACSLLGLCLS